MASSVACNIPTLSAGLFSVASSPSMSKNSQVSSLKAASPLKLNRSRSSMMAPRASSPQVSNESLKVNDLSKVSALCLLLYPRNTFSVWQGNCD
jgi:hypothetical protein